MKKFKSIVSSLRSGQGFFRIAQSLFKALGICFFGIFLTACQSHLQGGMLYPKGLIAAQERELFMDALALMLIVVLPVIIMSFVFAYKYRVKAQNKDYNPRWTHNVFLETIWWGVPTVIIVILGILTWKTTHELDPYKRIPVPGKVLNIQVVALPWKWLFIYPGQNIATVNKLELPEDQQVEFWITADAPMSAFGIPQLGSQIYAMAGMRTRLHLLPLIRGTYVGMDTQYNGDGFSDMQFKVDVVKEADFKQWQEKIKSGTKSLMIPEYKSLVKPSVAHKVEYYSKVEPKLFKKIMMQYMMPNMRLH